MQGLVGVVEDRAGAFEYVAAPADIQRHDAHRLADRDHRQAGLLGNALGGAVPRAGLARLDIGVGHELGRRAHDPAEVVADDDGAEVDIEWEAARAERLDATVVAEHDQGAGIAAQDALQPVAKFGAGSHRGQGGPQLVVLAWCHADVLRGVVDAVGAGPIWRALRA